MTLPPNIVAKAAGKAPQAPLEAPARKIVVEAPVEIHLLVADHAAPRSPTPSPPSPPIPPKRLLRSLRPSPLPKTPTRLEPYQQPSAYESFSRQ
ncbi:hypothetical protein SEUCBS139899_000890 [Sporothrix eucalyptigena]|uniref:Uncharacterized protein n=1 Tax=Sporothrix eucalyptigena TaxID=1812306 RepID=A0ABP0BIV5_9PEZI